MAENEAKKKKKKKKKLFGIPQKAFLFQSWSFLLQLPSSLIFFLYLIVQVGNLHPHF
jgi:hypothetical protein